MAMEAHKSPKKPGSYENEIKIKSEAITEACLLTLLSLCFERFYFNFLAPNFCGVLLRKDSE